MSQMSVERVIGLLVTDEGFRRRFKHDPRRTLDDLARQGVQLSHFEVDALLELDLKPVAQCADAIDPRLQKCDLRGDG